MAAIEAIDIKKPTIVGTQGGGSKDVFPGDVLFVGKGADVSEDDARYLVAAGRAEECERSLRTERKKAAAAAKKAEQ